MQVLMYVAVISVAMRIVRHEAACATELESNSIALPYALATRHPEHRQMFCCNSTRVSATLQEARRGYPTTQLVG
ncbi:hypothetical protein TGAM01_v204934 [Trichoderma gamsii]|uniref:Uncharacterized protein n=1 Tax=Trichoderma gamsii TaxID=398673 RepID=A0A2P4ZNX5_9HYPO|nr:hypothetical protein TGAM01_v204934 [Trichoderma gamsii]PON25990.1 hypothetical protein TGAM01_v204934 [Trichoderma gamsii]